MPLSLFDGIVYINLDCRKDRKETFLQEMERLNVPEEKTHRIAAHHDPLNGIKGCIISHLDALSYIKQQGWERGIIFEDDCLFTEDLESFKQSISTFFQQVGSDWDVFFLGGNYIKYQKAPWKNFLQIHWSRRSHAYCIRKGYIPVLAECYERAYEKIKNCLWMTQCFHDSLDYAWEDLQMKGRWYAHQQSSAFQSASFSDIECRDRGMR